MFRLCAMTAGLLVALGFAREPVAAGPAVQGEFDHAYATYARTLASRVHSGRVDYRSLASDRASVAAISASFAGVAPGVEQAWPREKRLAFWINAYNFFTLRAVLDHYPIEGRLFSLYPRNSIRQIDGVWSKLTWRVAGRDVTLDDIEHRILRPVFKEPRVHFAINCASVGCPPLRADPYLAPALEAQLDEGARRYLAGPQGLRLEDGSVAVTSILKWYGADFIDRFASLGPPRADPQEAAILGLVVTYGSPAAATAARRPGVKIRYLDYDWTLNDVPR